MNLDVHFDASHSWLKVPIKLLVEYKLQDKISSSSYISKDNQHVYLEEDSDAPKFYEASLYHIWFNEINDGDISPIRYLRRYHPDYVPSSMLLERSIND
jgi:hypothetical protein